MGWSTNIFGPIISELFDPGFELFKGLPFGDVIDDNRDSAVLVIYFGYGFVFFLPRSIPELELDFFVGKCLCILEVYGPKSGL